MREKERFRKLYKNEEKVRRTISREKRNAKIEKR